MRVLVNELTAIRQKAGVGHYIAELLTALRGVADDGDEVQTYPGTMVRAGMAGWNKARTFLGRVKISPGGRVFKRKPRLNFLGRRLISLHFRAFAGLHSFDVYHEPNHIPLPCARPTVATVHDLSVLLHPEWHPADRVAYYERHFEAGLSRCAHVLAGSEFTRQELARHFHVPLTRITPSYYGVRRGLRPMSAAEVAPIRLRLGLPEKFLLHVGTLEPRKNLLMLMRAYVGLPRSVRERCPLVLAGGWGWNVESLGRYYEDVARHHEVRRLGYLADEDLAAVYNAASALVFPSHYEGFGLPPLEMIASGGAVLASTAGAVVETVGGFAELLDPTDQEAWRLGMLRLIEDEEWRRSLVARASAFVCPYSWERCAAVTWQVYRKVTRGASPSKPSHQSPKAA